MAISDISLTSGMRSNLLSLQNTQTLLDRTQERLSSGNKVNSALDNPTSYFTSQALTSRASKIDSLKDAMGQGIQTITAANEGITSITALIEQAKGIAQSAMSAAAGATTTLNGADNVTVAGTVTIDLSGMTQYVTGSVSFQLTSGMAVGNTVGIGGQTFTYTTGTPLAGAFTDAAGLAALISTITGYSAVNVSGTITVVHSAIVTTDLSGTAGVVTVATQVLTHADGDSITLTGGTILTAGIDFTSTGTLVTALISAGYTGASAVGDLVTAAKATTTLLADITSTLTVAQGANEVRSFTLTDASSVAHIYTYTAGTDFTAGSTAAGVSVATLLKTTIESAGLGTVTVSGATATVVGASVELESYQTQYNETLKQITALANDSEYKGKNLLIAGQTLVVKFEGADATLNVESKDSTATGLGLSNATAWAISTNIDATITALDGALSTLSSSASSMSSGLSIVTVRQDFSTNMVNTLQEGSDLLILADTNEEGANMLMLQTRQSLGTTALSLSSQAAQSVLKLFS
jgi:flagellin